MIRDHVYLTHFMKRPCRHYFCIAYSILCLRIALLANSAPETNIIIKVEALTLTSETFYPGSRALNDTPGLILRDQGSGSPQADLSIRGSTFNSAGLLLNALTLRNSQTEHWHADMPLPDTWLASPVVLTGLERFRTAPGHPSGSISLELSPMADSQHTFTSGAGSKELFFGKMLATQVSTFNHALAGASGFLAYDRAAQTDGYRDNHLERASVGGRIGASNADLQADLLTTHSWRTFGARGFYGLDPKYPAVEQLRDTMVAGSLKANTQSLNPNQLTLAWRRTDDTYWLDRDNHAFYESNHITDFFALHGDTHRVLYQDFTMDLRADTDLETINSNALGDHTRSHASFAILPNYTLQDFTLTLGGSCDLFSNDRPAWLPAAGVKWQLNDTHTLFVSYTEAVRQPSYTELNYNSPSSLGNSGLEHQKTRTTEVGWRQQSETFKWQTTLFYEENRNLVDWLKTTPGSRWNSVNLDTLQTWGLALDSTARLNADTDIGLDLLALVKTCHTDLYASRYALDYPEFSFGAKLRHHLRDDLVLTIRQAIATYHNNAVRQNNDLLIHTALEFQWQIPRIAGFILNAGVANLFADDFQIYPGQPSAGRRFFTSLTYTW